MEAVIGLPCQGDRDGGYGGEAAFKLGPGSVLIGLATALIAIATVIARSTALSLVIALIALAIAWATLVIAGVALFLMVSITILPIDIPGRTVAIAPAIITAIRIDNATCHAKRQQQPYHQELVHCIPPDLNWRRPKARQPQDFFDGSVLPFRSELTAAAPGFCLSASLFFGFLASRFDFF